MTPLHRFWSHVNGPWCDPRLGPDDCWRWMGATAGSRRPKGLKASRPYKRYGRVRIAGELMNAHRAALLVSGVEPTAEAQVASHFVCDSPLCCNPNHLRFESQQANIADALGKGRLGRLRGRFVSTGATV